MAKKVMRAMQGMQTNPGADESVADSDGEEQPAQPGSRWGCACQPGFTCAQECLERVSVLP